MKTARRKIAQKLLGVGLVLWLGSGAAARPGAAVEAAGGAGGDGGGADSVRGLYDPLLANMRSGPALGAGGRYARIDPVVRSAFDIEFMARLAVGPEWERLAPAHTQA